MLPGHAYSTKRCKIAGATDSMRPIFAAYFSTKQWAGTRTSSPRSRSGGTRMGKTFKR